jgi:hypothetical protein
MTEDAINIPMLNGKLEFCIGALLGEGTPWGQISRRLRRLRRSRRRHLIMSECSTF